MKKSFQKIQQNMILHFNQPPILSNTFFKKKTKIPKLQPHLLQLTSNFILYFQKQNNYTIKRILILDFDTKFQILKDLDQNCIGIRFQRQFHQSYELFTHQSNVIKLWQKQLEKKINKRNFTHQYNSIKKIGKGNFATVYLSYRLSDKKKFAVKAFSKSKLYAQQSGKQSLINQIKLLRLFNHKNIIKLQLVYESANSVYLVLEYLEGLCLNQLLQNQKLPSSQIKNVMKGVLNGLSELSKKNVIHRDLKPDNIMFRTTEINSDVVIIDFGLATVANQIQYIFQRCGTPGFVAPQIINLRDFSLKCKPISDIFSLGVIFHILLFNKSIIQGSNYYQIMTSNRLCNFSLYRNQYNNLTSNCYDLLKRMLQINPFFRNSAQQCLKHEYFKTLDNQKNSSIESIPTICEISTAMELVQQSGMIYDVKQNRVGRKRSKLLNYRNRQIQLQDI